MTDFTDVMSDTLRRAYEGDLVAIEALIAFVDRGDPESIYWDPDVAESLDANPELQVHGHVLSNWVAHEAEGLPFSPGTYLEALRDAAGNVDLAMRAHNERLAAAQADFAQDVENYLETHDENGLPIPDVVAPEDGRAPDHENGEISPHEIGSMMEAIVGLKQTMREARTDRAADEAYDREIAAQEGKAEMPSPKSIDEAIRDLHSEQVAEAQDRSNRDGLDGAIRELHADQVFKAAQHGAAARPEDGWS